MINDKHMNKLTEEDILEIAIDHEIQSFDSKIIQFTEEGLYEFVREVISKLL